MQGIYMHDCMQDDETACARDRTIHEPYRSFNMTGRTASSLLVLAITLGAVLAKVEQPVTKLQIGVKGQLLDGTIFDESYKRGTPFSFTLGKGEVIKGWDQGINGMCVGEVRKLKIPPSLGYGSRGAPPTIPADATLIFETKLVSIEGKETTEAEL